MTMPTGPSHERWRLDFAPWLWAEATDEERDRMRVRLADLVARGYALGADCTVSELAVLDADSLELGDRSYVAAHAHLTGTVRVGADCSINVGTAVRGQVSLGDGVRVGAQSAVLGFNHSFDDPDVETFRQPLTSRGITIGDDVWIGTHVVVVDGVRVGSHAVIGAGAVVTHDVAEWAIVVGNPGRQIGDRRARGGRQSARPALDRLAEDARAAVPNLLERAWVDGAYRDRADAEPTVRAHCDAIELADLLLDRPPRQLSAEQHVERLRSWQDASTGLVPELDHGPAVGGDVPVFGDHDRAYHVLSVGYALALLGSSLQHPIRALASLTPDTLRDALDQLPWSTHAWGAGAVVDSLGTALTWATIAAEPGSERLQSELVRWLTSSRDPGTGLWGSTAGGLREPVNGTYRLLRGTYAQWGLRGGPDDALVDTVLRRASEVLRPTAATNTCDFLDVVHPLWWAGEAARTRRANDVAEVAHAVLDLAVDAWVPGAGAVFDAESGPSLQGTEMWLATAWYAADLLGEAGPRAYRPRGIHRPEPAPSSIAKWVAPPRTTQEKA